MKCIKLVKNSKGHEIGEIVRVNDAEAESRVKIGYWSYIPKSEWKKDSKPVVVETTNNEVVEQTIAEKQLKNKKKEKVSK